MQTVLRQRRSVLIQLCVGYAYAHNNPATFYDTSGLKDEEETGSYKWVHPESTLTCLTIFGLSQSFGNGTVLTTYRDGRVAIDGYDISWGVSDPHLLAEYVDKYAPEYAETNPLVRRQVLIGLGCSEGASTRVPLCTGSFREMVQDDWALTVEAIRGGPSSSLWSILGEAMSLGMAIYSGKSARGGGYQPAPRSLPAFPTAKRATRKTPVQGCGGLRARWKDDEGNIYEWDSRHGTVERYDRRGRHTGEYDPYTGNMLNPANPSRTVEP